MNGSLLFFASFLRDPKTVAWIFPTLKPTSRTLTRSLADAGKVQTLVELGPGSGAITKEFLKPGVLHPKSRLVVVELLPELVAYMRKTITDPRCIIVQGDAADLCALLQEQGITQIDGLLSGIPFSQIPLAIGNRIMDEVALLLRPGAKAVAYQMHPRVRGLLAKRFAGVTTEWLPWNLPPIRMFSGRKR